MRGLPPVAVPVSAAVALVMRAVVVGLGAVVGLLLGVLVWVGSTAQIRHFESTCYAPDGRRSFTSKGVLEFRVAGYHVYEFYGLGPEGFDRCEVAVRLDGDAQ